MSRTRWALAHALLMAILPKTLLALVRCHFMALTLLSAWHNIVGRSSLIEKDTPIRLAASAWPKHAARSERGKTLKAEESFRCLQLDGQY